MPEGTLVETVYGKYSKYDVYKNSGVWSTKFEVYKDDKYWKTFGALDAAMKEVNRDK